jgi:hypothetical protein
VVGNYPHHFLTKGVRKMNIKGKKVLSFPPVIIPIIRGEEDLFFQAQVSDMTEFATVCKRPEPPMIQHKGQTQAVADIEDPKYKIAIEQFVKNRIDYMIIKSLSATPDLQWDKVKLTNPETYHLYVEELKEFGLTVSEIDRLINGVFEANGLDESKIEESKKRFLAAQKAH